MAIDKANNIVAISACIESCCYVTRWIPNQVGVNSHAVIICVELREAVARFNFFRMPLVPGELAKRSRVKAKNGRYAHEGRFVEIALAQLVDCFRSDPRFFGQLRIGNAQPALRLSNDVTHVVFERNHVSIC